MQGLDLKSAVALACWIFCFEPANASVLVYTNDFDGGESFVAGVSGGLSGVTTTESVQGYAGYGNGADVFSGDFLRNTTTGNPALPTTLTLIGLPSHTSISLDFLLAVIDSWDGSSSAGNMNSFFDLFNVRVDGVTVFSQGIDEVVLGDNYSPPPDGLVVFKQQLGFSTGPGVGWFDSGYDMGLEPSLQNIAHTASSVTIEWFGSGTGYGIGPSTGNDGTDETWGIENLRVTVNPVPEPSGLALLATGVTMAIGYRCRQRSSPAIRLGRGAPVEHSARCATGVSPVPLCVVGCSACKWDQ